MHFFSKYRDTEHVQLWLLRQSTLNSIKLPYEYDVNYFQKLMSKSLTLEQVSIYSQVNNTREGVLLFYKAWWRLLVSIRIFEYFRGRIFESTFSNESQP